ncbi:glycosyltransferase [Bifidobacterium longum]|uniref:glycosyltransferase n=1 Tax=Bifidobacterium longum TaxID=216816 RepID=UPI000C30A7A7|nr:glycosyltransferase [Bifidobacterium longum]PKD10924.1 glycosyltransferase [Bifidobacterium longum]
MCNISVLVVVYNTSIDSVPVISKALENQYVSDIVVCDNSTLTNMNSVKAAELGLTYVSMQGNRGLSVAYNAGIEKAEGDVICVFDDDTFVPDDYFDKVEKLKNSDKHWDIALPAVISNDRILSPCIFKGYRSHLFTSREDIKDDLFLSGINSGMAVKKEVYSRTHYNESLFLDLIDHQFIMDAKKNGAAVVFLDGPVLKQSYSLDVDSKMSACKRFKIFSHDASYFYSSSMLSCLYCKIMLLIRRIKIFLRYF